MPGRDGFQITRVEVGDDVTITWRSREGATYKVEGSESMAAAQWQELVNGLPSAGVETSYSDTTAPQGVPARYYRVTEQVGP
jgi:hypothetical protein